MNWNDTVITLPYTFENFKALLNSICTNKNNFPQFEFAKWCDNLAMSFDDDEADILSRRHELALLVARDIECQWDLYLINSYTDKELRTLDLSQVCLPQEWFLRWFKELSSL